MAERAWPLPWLEVAGRRGGAWQYVQYLLYRAAVGLGSRLPRAGRRAMSWTLGSLLSVLDRERARATTEFIAQAYPNTSERERRALLLCAWRHLIELVLEDARFNERVVGPRLAEHFEVELTPRAREAIGRGQGGLVITPHVGMWEALPAILPRLGLDPLYAVSRPPKNRYLASYAQAVREARGYRLIPRHGAIDHLLAAVGGGAWVGLMLDQRAHGKTVIAPFFGRPAHCERSIAVLVRRVRRPVVLAACYAQQGPRRFKVVLDAPLAVEELSTLDAEGIASALNREMEHLIRRAPEQYFWLHDRYRHAPSVGRA
ncbi:MAG: lysophospholipid acyltransferase family protein [Planctomycetes bacterium]|nr:lysophospholipid acyltransferase family protein [Planctomycetota bacterium]